MQDDHKVPAQPKRVHGQEDLQSKFVEEEFEAVERPWFSHWRVLSYIDSLGSWWGQQVLWVEIFLASVHGGLKCQQQGL